MSRVLFRTIPCFALALLMAGCTPTEKAKAPQKASPQSTAPELPAPAAQQSKVSAPEQSKPAQNDQVQALIGQVEQAFAEGQADYRKGDLPEAKAAFDRAVDLMLGSGLDIKADSRLQDEFDHVVDAVNGLEMEALKQGNGFAPKEEPAPADVANDVTFAVDPNIVAKAKSDLATTKSDLPLVVNDYVAAFINFFANTQKGHNTLLHSFQRYGRYKGMIERTMADEGVPHDLIYLAVAESGFQPRAVNPGSRAGGMWQFMPYGSYGLKRNAYVDERFDPEKSTRAYARYMKFIYAQLGDWYLSMAAYDHGTGNIQREVQRTGYADFWELYKRNELPRETANYVPEILAAIIIANHPKQYGFDEITLDPPVVTDTVTINYSVDLRLAADLVGAPIDELEALNPSLLRMATPPDDTFDLHLPAGGAELFQKRIASIPESKRDAWRYHTVVANDTLDSVARSYHVSVSELAAANQLSESASLDGIEAVVVPTAPVMVSSSHSLLYTTRRGDTLVSIADRFGVSLTQLRRWNHLSGYKVAPGKRLRIAEPARVVRTRSTSSRARGTSASASLRDGPPSKTKIGTKTGTKAGAKSGSATGKKKARAAQHSSAAHAGSKARTQGKSGSHPATKRKPTTHKQAAQ
ncbi:MAG TPA: LysM peptidoglycan-binding domain-containing protein [Terracidiphilus sp.]|jgi:membrane-bound lytic murein transglycosylase D|nr:LysM peptidoglycan-binding domain-containing protein [Terracidiphilus sp.]